jgi:uncharacterized membrane protein YvbJ
MDMIECPQCGKEISDQVKSCPHCGFSVGVARLGRYLEQRQKEHPKAYRVLKFLFMAVIFAVAFWMLARR